MENIGSVVHSEGLVIYLSLFARALNLACGLQLLGCVPMGVIVPIRRNVIGDYLAGNAVYIYIYVISITYVNQC